MKIIYGDIASMVKKWSPPPISPYPFWQFQLAGYPYTDHDKLHLPIPHHFYKLRQVL